MRFIAAIPAVGVVLLLGVVAWAGPTSPTYQLTVQDAVTGDNEFTNGGTHYWFVNTNADDYANDGYERPTAQNYEYVIAQAKVGNDPELVVGSTYSATGFSNPAYYGYVDIVSGKFGYDSQYMYFAIELYSVNKVGNNGQATSDFGEGTFYNIRLSEDANGKGGVLLSAENAKDLTGSYQLVKQFGYFDRDGTVGGPGGVGTPDEGLGGNPGYETVIIADGKAKDVQGGSTPELLWARRTTSSQGRPVVEFAVDYTTLNALDFLGTPDPSLEPQNFRYLVYDATRGLKGQGNYLWNDKYSLDEAGTPYTPSNEPENIYELDTLRVPEPMTASIVCLGGMLLIRRPSRPRFAGGAKGPRAHANP